MFQGLFQDDSLPVRHLRVRALDGRARCGAQQRGRDPRNAGIVRGRCYNLKIVLPKKIGEKISGKKFAEKVHRKKFG
jgi:hypothetical protein